MIVNVFEVEPNENRKLKSRKGLEQTYKTAKRTETDVQTVNSKKTVFFTLTWLLLHDFQTYMAPFSGRNFGLIQS